jgi:hypothetical protein
VGVVSAGPAVACVVMMSPDEDLVIGQVLDRSEWRED